MEKKRPQGRPSKIGKFTEVMRDILDTEHPVGFAIIHTDEDLVEMVNERLDPDERIDIRNFYSWKAGGLTAHDELLCVFSSCYKRALRVQAQNLHERLATDVPGGWQRWAWILERKFDDWNMRSKTVDETPAPKQLVFTVLKEGESID